MADFFELARGDQHEALLFADRAAADSELAQAVAHHKSIFFAESAPDGTAIDYRAAVTGALRLVPDGEALRALAQDYQLMVEDGLLLDDAEPFEVLMARCREIATKINARVGSPL